MLKVRHATGKTNWVTLARNVLIKNGFGYILENQTVINEPVFVKTNVQRLKDQYIQTLNEACQNSPKLST